MARFHTRNFVQAWLTHIIGVAFLGLCFCGIVGAQLVNDTFCKEVEDLLITPLRPVHWYRNITFDDSCDFEFDIDFKGGAGAMVELERFNSKREARKSFKSDRRMFKNAVHLYDKDGTLLGFVPPNIVRARAFWDESDIYLGDSQPLTMLRKNKTVVTVFCDQEMLCARFEQLLSDHPSFFGF